MSKKLSVKVLLIVCFLFFAMIAFFMYKEKETEGYIFVDGAYRNLEPVALVIILGNHANAMEIPQDAYYVIEEQLDRVVYGGYLCVIVVDATPTKVELMDGLDFFREDAKNLVALQNKIKNRKEKVTDILKNLDIPADSPEVDLLAAIREAKNIFENNQVNSVADKQIYIADTGISTTGDLNFVNINFLNSKLNGQELVRELQNYEGVGVLPDLTGIKVTFIGTAEGLAEVAEPQKAHVTDKKFIRDLWDKIITACGASDVKFESVAGWDTPNIYTEDKDSRFPYVSAITFYHDDVYIPDTEQQQAQLPNIEVKLSSETIGFKPNEKGYLNETNARNTLQPFAEELKKFFMDYPDEKIWIVGTTAAVPKGAAGSIDLSLQRAETVKNTLVMEFDIPEEKLVTIGLGAKFPWHVDEYPDDIFDTSIAQANRAVWLLAENMDTDYFSKLKTAYDKKELLPEAMQRFSLLYD